MRLALGLLVVGLLASGIGFAVRRWAIIPVAALVWPASFFGVHESWWGTGLGDGWDLLLALYTAATTAGAILGVLARRRHALHRASS